MRTTITLTAAALALSACAPGFDSIAPVPAPAGAYSGMTCTQLHNERQQITQQLSTLESQQRSAQASDAVGVFLIGVPTGSLTGGDKQGTIAAVKGQDQALRARIANQCP